MVGDRGKVRISVAMVTFNGACYIKEQLDSIISQLGEADELVISDDGSSDGTLAIIREYQKADKRIRLVEGPRQGIKKNVEHAIAQANGDYIFLADQDDIWMPGKVETVMQAFEEQKSFVVIHDAKVFEGGDREHIIMESFYEFRGSKAGVLKNMVKNSYIGCCMAFRRELTEFILPIPEKIEMHDQWIGIISDLVSGPSCFLREPLLLYRRHGENNSNMSHYSLGKMLRNRIVFFGYFFVRILQICHNRQVISGNFKKNDS